jgi:hypothetical protein
MTIHAPPPAVPGEDDLLFKILGGLGRTLGHAIRYWFRRARHDPGVGLLYAATWLPVLGLLVQIGHQAWVNGSTPGYELPAPQWPLGGRVFSVPELVVLVSLLLPAVVCDLIRTGQDQRRATRPAPDTPLQVGLAEWVVGWVVARTWNPDPGAWVTTRTRDLFRLTAQHLRVNLLVVAPQGAGKTSMVLNPILRLCRRTGAACLVFDVKGDPPTPHQQPDFDPGEFHVTLDFAHPERSARLNLAGGGTPREIGEQLGEALIYDSSGDKAYFVNNAKDALGGLFAAYGVVYGQIPSFRQTLHLLRSKEARADLHDALQQIQPTDPARALVAADAQLDLARIDQIADGKHDVLGNLDLALAPLARGAIADLLVSDDSGWRLADLLNAGARVRIILPVARQPRVAPIIGRLILAQFTTSVLDPSCNRQRLKLALVDEAHWFITPSLPSGMAQARTNFGGYVLALQDLAQITDTALREKIWGVATNRLVMAGVGDYDAAKFSRTWGEQERLYIMHSRTESTGSQTSRSRGHGQHSGGSAGGAALGGGSTQQHTSRTAIATHGAGEQHQLRLRAEWLPAEIHGLPAHHVVVERRDATGHVTPPVLVALDRTLTDPLQLQQDRQLVQQIGRRDAAAFQRPQPGFASVSQPPALRTAQSPPPASDTTPNAAPAIPCRSPFARVPTPGDLVTTDNGWGRVPPADDSAQRNPGAGPATPTTAHALTIAVPNGFPAVARTELVAAIADGLRLDRAEVEALIAQAITLGWTPAQLRSLLAEIQTNVRSGAPAVVFRTRVRVQAFPKGA